MVDPEWSREETIKEIFAKAGLSWSSQERDEVKAWLCEITRLNELRYFAKRHLGSGATLEDAEDAWPEFFTDRLDRVIDLYDPGAREHREFWEFCKFCFKRFCWRRGQSIGKRVHLTQSLELKEDGTESSAQGELSQGAARDFYRGTLTADNPFQTGGENELRGVLEEAISSLRLDFQRVLAMYYIDQMKVEEIARSLGSPVNTIKLWLHRARMQLKPYLKERGFDNEKS